jgi:hypothetical protein
MDTDADSHTSSGDNSSSDDLMEMSPAYVRNNGLFTDRRQHSPRGSIKKPKFLTPMQGESGDVSFDEARSDGQRRGYSKSKEGRRYRQSTSDSSEDDQSPEVRPQVL